jgi:hypothetical protein
MVVHVPARRCLVDQSQIKDPINEALAGAFPGVQLVEASPREGLYTADLPDDRMLWVDTDTDELVKTRMTRGVLIAVLPRGDMMPWNEVPDTDRLNLSWPPTLAILVEFLTRHAQKG